VANTVLLLLFLWPVAYCLWPCLSLWPVAIAYGLVCPCDLLPVAYGLTRSCSLDFSPNLNLRLSVVISGKYVFAVLFLWPVARCLWPCLSLLPAEGPLRRATSIVLRVLCG